MHTTKCLMSLQTKQLKQQAVLTINSPMTTHRHFKISTACSKVSRSTYRLLSRGDDSLGHSYVSCMHQDMSNQYMLDMVNSREWSFRLLLKTNVAVTACCKFGRDLGSQTRGSTTKEYQHLCFHKTADK